MDGELVTSLPGSPFYKLIIEAIENNDGKITLRKEADGRYVYSLAYVSPHHNHIEIETIPRTITTDDPDG